MVSVHQGRAYTNIRKNGFRNLNNNIKKTSHLREGFTSKISQLNTAERQEKINLIADLDIEHADFIKKIAELDEIINTYPIISNSVGNTIICS